MQNSDWAFNLRATSGLEDSDSDSDCAESSLKDDSNNVISAEAKLLKDLDLSSRQETVEYKPNPWNIAKINAASRSTKPPQVPVTNSAKTKKVPQGRIVDLFKIQSEKPRQPGGVKPDDPVHRPRSNPRAPSDMPEVVCIDRPAHNGLSSHSTIQNDAPVLSPVLQDIDRLPESIPVQENIQQYARKVQGHQGIAMHQPRPRLQPEPATISTSFSSPLRDQNQRVGHHTTWNSHSAFHSSPTQPTYNASRFMNNTPVTMEGGGAGWNGVGGSSHIRQDAQRFQNNGASSSRSFSMLLIS